MSEAHAGGCEIRGGNGGTVAGVICFLSFAAAPTFAGMALLAAAGDAGATDVLCMAVQHGSPVSGMALMYALMAAFHSAPWLRLMFARGHADQRA